jgi:PKHD-type hydroxylase
MQGLNFCYFDKALNQESVNQIIDICSEYELEDGMTGAGKTKVRDSLISWVSDQKLFDMINPYILKANQTSGWNFDLVTNENCQYTVYNKSQHFGWHTDQIMPMDNGLIRKLSMTVQLTDPNEYDGGEFLIKYLDEDGNPCVEELNFAKGLGTIIVFPSYVWHKVTPVTKGTRKSLVCWTLGYPFK